MSTLMENSDDGDSEDGDGLDTDVELLVDEASSIPLGGALLKRDTKLTEGEFGNDAAERLLC